MTRTIQNFDALAETNLRRVALSIAEAGYEAINIGKSLSSRLVFNGDVLEIGGRSYPLANRRIFFVGVGKCSFPAAETIEKLLGERLTDGIALSPASVNLPRLTRIQTRVGTHPLPSEENEVATKEIINLLSGCTEDDLVLFLISGGGSTLLSLSEPPMTYLDEGALFTELTKQGATIQELNTVRKHTSLARGGGLAKAAYPAEIISLIVSDVPGNDIGFIASGPTVGDTSTVADAGAVLARYHIQPTTTTAFRETPKEERYFTRVTNILFLTNNDALAAMQDEAARAGYAAHIVDNRISGEARDIGASLAEKLHAAPPKTVLLYAGESTVTLGSHSGAGGRNQEMALAALAHIQPDELILPMASDGHDNTNYAGAIADAITLSHARDQNLSPDQFLRAHCSYDFFKTTGDALTTGYTESNVSDFIITIKD
jgi:glycerate-2-kinase